ncbi:GerMN domain-containing protein [Kocuria nitroreducens]|uniref:GerMN domain-containing protein n=1 Tax=Kocuria nitroreducens TaxID=3058914 RepID=UPI0036DAE853
MATARSRSARGRRPVLALSAVGVLVLGACGTGPEPALDDTVTTSATSATSATAPASSLAASTADGGRVATTRLPVYWVGRADGEERLFREFRDASEAAAAVDPIAAAAALMTGATPEDPDYRTLWTPVDRVGASTSPDGTITVDLPSEAFRPDLDDREVRLALQQLAHTVTATATTAGLLPEGSAAQVVVLVDGRPDEEVFGSVRLDGHLTPDETMEAPIRLDEPRQDERTEGSLTLSGRALDGVRGCRWTVARPGGERVSSGAAAEVPRSDGTVAFRAELELEPGDYVVTVLGRDAEGRTVRDDKDVEVLPG